MCLCSFCVTHLEQTFCQSPSDLRPQKGAKEEQGNFGAGNVGVLGESLFGDLQTAVATVSPCVQHDGRGFGDEVQVSWHGLHSHRPLASGMTAHCDAERNVSSPSERHGEPREHCSPDWVANPSTSLLAHLKTLKQA